MCGIAGIYSVDGRPPDREALARMSASIGHRGPDRERFHFDVGLGLAHRHLRIIDLSDAAMQPMKNEDGTIWLVFNGEIYNYIELRPELIARGHTFVSHSDSEVIVHAYEEWGADCLQRFNGMFAFALWDSRKRRLFIARDRAGVKPLYYRWDGKTLLFASEIKALLMHPEVQIRPHLPAIAQYMSATFTTGTHTWFEGVQRLLPGRYIVVSPEGMEISQWWDLPFEEDFPGEKPESYYIEKTRALLEDSVRLRLRSDVPLGSHLSGGIDSSAVVALLSKQLEQHGERVRTFSGAFSEGQAYDERRYVHEVVEMYNTEHSETIPSSSDLPALFDRIIWHMDEPAAGPGILLQWAVCSLTRASGVTVINGGQGGDEAWGGYFGYVPAYLQTLRKYARWKPELYLELARDLPLMLLRGETRTAMLRALAAGRRGRAVAGSGAGPWAGYLFREGFDPRCGHAESTSIVGRSPLGKVMYYDLNWYLPALLQVEDRTSMAFSLESRAPLLDYRILEHAATVPSVLKMKGLEMKHVLRRSVQDLLPADIFRRRDKKGMPTPVDLWFKGSLAGWARESLAAADPGLLSPVFVQQALHEHTTGKADRSLDIWKMLSLTAWWRLYVDGKAPGIAAKSEMSIQPIPDHQLV